MLINIQNILIEDVNTCAEYFNKMLINVLNILIEDVNRYAEYFNMLINILIILMVTSLPPVHDGIGPSSLLPPQVLI